MGPIRRYLRITSHSVLEIRIYLKDPSLAQSWLLNERNPALPRIIETIRPFVLPKLREEHNRTQSKAKKRRAIKDTIHGTDFEVSFYLSDLSTRHALLTKSKTFDSQTHRIRSNSRKLSEWLEPQAEPIEIADDGEHTDMADPIVIREESDVSEDEGFRSEDSAPTDPSRAEDAVQEDKKKLQMKTSYDGFSIHGKILCLIVTPTKIKGRFDGGRMLETWVATQAAAEPHLNDAD